MKSLFSAVFLAGTAFLMIPVEAFAEPAYGWVFHRDITKSGVPICSLVTGPKSGDAVKNLAIKAIGKRDHLSVTLYKDTWNIPQGTPIITTIDFMDNEPLTLKSYGDGKVVDIEIPGKYTAIFLSLVHDSSFLQIGFPSGSEPTWSINLSGVTPSLKKFVGCTTSESKQNTQPF